MNHRLTLIFALSLAVAAVAASKDSQCLEYPYFGMYGTNFAGYEKMGQLYIDIRSCVIYGSERCIMAGVEGYVRAWEHIQLFWDSDKRRAIPYVEACLQEEGISQSAIDTVEKCLLKKLAP